MISSFGVAMKKIRSDSNDSLRTCASKLEITAPFLSAMEMGKRPIPSHYIDKIRNVYNLSEDDYTMLYNAVVETNRKVDIDIENMNESQKEVSMIFGRKIENADPELIDRLRKVLMEAGN